MRTSRIRRPARLLAPVLAAALGAVLAASTLPAAPATAGERGPTGRHHERGEPTVRFATFNASLNRATDGGLVADLAGGRDPQAAAVAEIVQRVRPDVLLLNEVDHDAAGRGVDLFRREYLQVGQGGARPIRYPHVFLAPSNTGVPSGHDLDNDGRVGGGNDAFGFGEFEGQYGMVVLSRYPIDRRRARTFQHFRWADMPGNRIPAGWYSPAELADLRLSSKSHWDVPVRVGGRTVHLLASHPTPPTFDGPADRNGARNADEIRFWADYVAGARYPYDDRGRRGGLPRGASFVVAGDLNSDPADGDSVPGAVQALLGAPRVTDPRPRSAGAREAAALQGGANAAHRGDPALDTADFADGDPGNLRVDYVLPSADLRVRRSGVFWPVVGDPLSRLTGTFPFPSSDHRAVWADLRLRRR